MNRDIDISATSEVADKIQNTKTEFYEGYRDITVSGIVQEYTQGNIEYISIPPQHKFNQEVWEIVLNKYKKEPELISKHALTSHPADSILAIETVSGELKKGNVLCTLGGRTQEQYLEGKEHEVSRFTLSTDNPIEREIPRYLHMQMAIEIASQIENKNTDMNNLLKCINNFGQKYPGFATILSCQLASLGAITDNLRLNVNDILKTVPIYKEKSKDDYYFVYNLYNTLAGGNVFSKESNDLVINEVLKRFPNEGELLKISKNFKESIQPKIVFESAYNIMIKEIFPRRGIDITAFAVNKLGTLQDTITSRIVTAYVEHTPNLTLGQVNAMLSDKTVSRFLTPTSSDMHSQTP